MKSTIILFVWKLSFSLATANGQQQASAYVTTPVDAARPTIIESLGNEDERYEAGFAWGLANRLIDVDDRCAGGNMILKEGKFNHASARTYAETCENKMTGTEVTVTPFGYIKRSKEFFGWVMPFKVYMNPYEIPGAPPAPVEVDQFPGYKK